MDNWRDYVGKDLYGTLGIPPTSTIPEIQKAYRRLTLQFHPDKNLGDPAAAAKFKEVKDAFEVLSDREARKEYDQMLAAQTAAFGGGREDPRRRRPDPKDSQEGPSQRPSASSVYYCPNRARGCTWMGPRPSFRAHIMTCAFCEEWVMLIRNHLRDQLASTQKSQRNSLQQSRARGEEAKSDRDRDRALCFSGGLVLGFMLGITAMIAVLSMYGQINLFR